MKISSEFLYEYLAPDWSIEKDGNQKELSDLRFPRFFSAVKPEAEGMYFADYSEMIENCSYDRNSEKKQICIYDCARIPDEVTRFFAKEYDTITKNELLLFSKNISTEFL